MRLKRWDKQSLLTQPSPGKSHIHHSQKHFFNETSSLLSVPDPSEPTDLSKLASSRARDVAVAVLELGTHHLRVYLSRYTQTLAALTVTVWVPAAPGCASVVSAQRIQCTNNNSPSKTMAVSGHSPFLHTGLRARMWSQSFRGLKHKGDALVGPWVELIWKYKLNPDLLVLIKASAKHWRDRVT